MRSTCNPHHPHTHTVPPTSHLLLIRPVGHPSPSPPASAWPSRPAQEAQASCACMSRGGWLLLIGGVLRAGPDSLPAHPHVCRCKIMHAAAMVASHGWAQGTRSMARHLTAPRGPVWPAQTIQPQAIGHTGSAACKYLFDFVLTTQTTFSGHGGCRMRGCLGVCFVCLLLSRCCPPCCLCPCNTDHM